MRNAPESTGGSRSRDPEAEPGPGRAAQSGRDPDHEVVIIGAGLSGLGAGIALKRAGIEDFVILERADDIGGTWRQNRYPDVGVDLPAFTYQFSYEKVSWSRLFPKGAEVKAYIDHCAEKYGLWPHIRLGSGVSARSWDAAGHMWRVSVGERTITARYVITAIGAFVDPKPCEIPGVEDFAGKLIRSQEWDHDYDLGGKRVGVIGTGASAIQLIPPIGEVARQLHVFQRRPPYVYAKPDYLIPGAVQKLFRYVPGAQEALRLAFSAIVEVGLVGATQAGERMRTATSIPERACIRFMHSQISDPELRRKLTPDYAFGCKRPAMSNTYYRTFTRPNVELVTDRIERITPDGVMTVDGRERELDALVLATGFRLSYDPENYRRVPVTGRDGFDLADFFANEPVQAYEGVSLPQLPNTFMIFGPYSWTGSSWHVLVETQSHHAVRVITEARRRRATMVAVTEDANRRFHEFARGRARHLLSTGCETANTYYFDHHGQVTLLRPTTTLEAWWASHRFSLDDYEYRAVPADGGALDRRGHVDAVAA